MKRAKFVHARLTSAYFFKHSRLFVLKRKKRGGGIGVIIIIKINWLRSWAKSKGRIDKFAGKKVGEGNLAVNGTRLVAVRPPTNGRARQ